MQLSRDEFERRYTAGTLRLAFVGMSNIGKSYTAMRLATRYDYDLIEVDQLIWAELGQTSMDDFAAWQGQPYSDGYAEREAESIRLETTATLLALKSSHKNAILDTTGSVIYTGQTVLDVLRRDWFVVHIEASAQALEQLKAQYFANPKPLVWREHYHCKPKQDKNAAILASYPGLLASRATLYATLADRTISSDIILNTDLTIDDIYEQLKPAR